MKKKEVNNEYFEWMYKLVCKDKFAKEISFRKLLMYLHSVEFRYTIPKDRNRYYDGTNLRYRFILQSDYDNKYTDYIDGPCSVLEMMVALAIRCEENIMDDTSYGDRTAQWFWGMITSLGLGGMEDSRFDKREVVAIVERFLDREYEKNGKGGLFTIKGCRKDLRKEEIWYQLCWYLDGIM